MSQAAVPAHSYDPNAPTLKKFLDAEIDHAYSIAGERGRL